MKTKKDFWRLTLFTYLFIFSGLILLFSIEEDSQFEIYFLVGVIILEVSGLVIGYRALNVYHSLDDKSVYPKQLDFINRLNEKIHTSKKQSKLIYVIAIVVGALIGFLSEIYGEGLPF